MELSFLLRRWPSLPEVHGTVHIPAGAGFWRKMLAFSGPGYLVAVGYMDPGNWATDLAGGARFYYTLLSVILLSNMMAIVLQSLAARLGIGAGRDLAQACRDSYSRGVMLALWVLCEVAIAACDLAEVIGSAIALKLLFGIPIVWGVCITAFDVLMVLYLQNRGFRWVEALVISMIGIIAVCFAAEIFWAQPDWKELVLGFIPTTEIVRNPEMLYIAIGILGATVMPHNLYLHSSIVQTRKYLDTVESKKEALKFATIDSTVALGFALFINAAILVVAAATFYNTGYQNVADIEDAHRLLSPVMGITAASILFAIALLASGQNSTLTGTLAGQIVMEGFLNIRLRPWLRRLITRLIAIVPAVIVAVLYGERGTGKLLILSQVILSLQLSSDPRDVGIYFWRRRALDILENGIRGAGLSGVEPVPILGQPFWLDSGTLRRFQWTGVLAEGKRCHTNKVPCHTELEKHFADFLDGADDVVRYFKNERFGFSVTYYEGNRPRQYYPDFIVAVRDSAGHETTWLAETKGEERPNTALKSKAAELWCEKMSRTAYGQWRYLFVPQRKFDASRAAGVASFRELVDSLVLPRTMQLRFVRFEDPRVKVEAFKTLLPLYSLRAAAGYFGHGEAVEREAWVDVGHFGRLDERMFVCRAVGHSMEPRICDGDYMVLRANPAGTRQGKIVLAQYRGLADPDTGGAFTVKRYSSRTQDTDDGSWRHTDIVLSPLNPAYKPLAIPERNAKAFRILAEFIAVLKG